MNWDNITLKQAEEIEKIYAQEGKHHLRKHFEVYAYVMGLDKQVITADELMNMPTDKCDKLREPYSFLDTPRQIVSKTPTTWEGFKITYDIRKASAGQFIDNDELSRMEGVTAAQRLAVLMQKEGMEFEDRVKYIHENLPITIADGVLSFFLTRTSLLLKLSLKFSALILRIKKKQMMNRFKWIRFKRTLSGLFG